MTLSAASTALIESSQSWIVVIADFDHQIGHAGRVVPADGVAAIDDDFQVQAVMLQQHSRRCGRIAAIAGELTGVLQAGGADLQGAVLHGIAGSVGMAAGRKRHRRIKDAARLRDDFGGADFIEAAAARRAIVVGDRIGAVQRVVEAAPARIGRVQCISSIRNRHDKLRAGDAGDLRIDVGRADRDALGFVHQVADAAQEAEVAVAVGRFALVGDVPRVDLLLNAVALLQQRLAARREIGQQRGETAPKSVAADGGPGEGFVADEIKKRLGDADAG